MDTNTMQVSVEKVSNVECRVTIVVPPTQLEKAYDKRLKQIAKGNIPGFKSGVITPTKLSYVRQRYGAGARQEALGEVIEQSLHQALVEQKLRPISTPKVEPKQVAANQPLEFVASFEILPEIDLVKFTAEQQIEKPVVDITDADIDFTLERLRKQFTDWKKVDREAQYSDRVVIDYYTVYEDKEDKEHATQGFPLELGSNTMLAGFEEGLLGAKAGEEKTLDLSFPEDFHIEDRRSKPIRFIVTIKEVVEAIMPVVDEEFAKQLGVKSGSVEDLRAQIKSSLTQERDRLIKEKLKEQIFVKLLEQNPLELPHSLIESEAHHIHDEMYPPHQPHHHHEHTAKETEMFNDIAKKRVTLNLLVNQYAKQADLKTDQARVMQRLQELAAPYENPKKVMEWLSSKEQIQGVVLQVLEDQVMDKLMEGVLIVEKPTTFPELKGIRV